MAAIPGMGSWPPPYPDETRGPLLLRVNWSLIGISAIVVIARVWTKFSKARRLYTDDICMLVALLFGLVHAALMSKAIQYGLGRHMAYLDPIERSGTLKFGVLCLGWGFLSPMAGRIAFCLTVLYISGTDRRVHKWAKYVTLVFIALQLIVNLLAFILFYAQCGTHLDIFWTTDPSRMALQPELCMKAQIQTDLGYFQGAFNCLTDLYLTVLPGILIEHTKLSIKKKLGLAMLLCLSILALGAAIVKTYEARALSEVLDYSYDLGIYVICIEIELNVVMVVSSIPLLRPLLTLFNKKHQRLPDQNTPGWDTASTMGSVFSKKVGSRMKSMSTSSEEHIVPHNSQIFYLEQPGIMVTREIEVTYQPNDVQFVHAALVGLVQGEIATRKLVAR